MTTTPLTPRPVTPPPGGPPPPPRSSVAATTLGVLLVAIGVIALLATTGVEVPVALVGAIVLILLGLGVVVSAVRGEPSGGIVGLAITVGVLLAVGSVVGTVLDVPLRGAVGERVYRPTTATEVEAEYRVLMGSLVLDLRDVALAPGTTEIEASTVLGQVDVRVPRGVPVSVDTEVGAGSAHVLGRQHDGVAVDNDVISPGFEGADQRIVLRLGAGLGEVRVTR